MKEKKSQRNKGKNNLEEEKEEDASAYRKIVDLRGLGTCIGTSIQDEEKKLKAVAEKKRGSVTIRFPKTYLPLPRGL